MLGGFRSWNTAFGKAVLSQNLLLAPSSLDILVLRGRKRALKQSISRQQKLERRMKREEKEAARKQFSFMERINIRRMKSLLSPSQQFPGRLRREEESSLPDSPPCDVFFINEVKTQFYTVPEALTMHRENQMPSIYNNPKAPIRLRMEFNMTTEKQTKMISSCDEIVPVPYPFAHNEKRTILAFVNDKKLQEMAVESGAEMAVGQDVIKKIIKGQFRVDDYDFCVAHQDMSSAILPLRGILKSRFPTKLNGGLGIDLPKMIEMFKNGVKLAIKSDPVYPIWGLANAVVGRLNMSDEEVEANIAAVITAACAHRNPALGPFINRALLMTVPGKEHYAIQAEKWMPQPTEEEIEKVEKRRNKKGKKTEDEDEVAATA